jgi:putative transposase
MKKTSTGTSIIHYNPVKPGLVNQVCDWPWSSFHRYVRMGFYEKQWGEAIEEEKGMVFGE